MARLDAGGLTRVPYTCRISGQKEEVLLLGSRLAERLVAALPEAMDADGARLLAGLGTSELCACDAATLTRLPEDAVLARLEAFTARGLLAQRRLHGMHHFRLASGQARRRIAALAEAAYSQAS